MVGLFLQSGYALLPSQPHHRVSSRLTRNLILFVARQIAPVLVSTKPWLPCGKATFWSYQSWIGSPDPSPMHAPSQSNLKKRV